jgi:Tfp pilus assembly protein PilX
MHQRTDHPAPPVPVRTTRHGFMLTDVVVGLSLLIAAATMVSVGLHQHRRASDHLAERRAAVGAAEAALNDLHAGREPGADGEAPVAFHVDPLERPAPEGLAWVALSAKRGDAQATLIGLIDVGVVEAMTGRQGDER